MQVTRNKQTENNLPRKLNQKTSYSVKP